ncbi:MAG: hypothetical protein AAFW73_26455 [Bacteroidota bacterium]
MRKRLIFLGFCSLFLLFGASMSSCSKKTGCPVNESVHVKTNRKGEFSKKGGRSNLFPKDMRAKRRN